MNIKQFLNLINKFKWLVLAITMITLLVTYLFVKNLPKEYKSQAKLSTGLLDPSKQVAPDVPNYSGPDLLIKINQQFTNIMDIMTMPKNTSILSYRLILHDLKNPTKPLNILSNDMKALTPANRQKAIAGFEERLAKQQVLTPFDNYDVKFYNLVKSMGYDAESITKKLDITHAENSDFITVEFTSTNTFFSVFVVNTLSRDFINTYSLDLISNKNINITVLDSLLKKKEAFMNVKIQELRNYKVKNRVLNLDKQSQIIYQQIGDYEDRKSSILREIQSYQNAIRNIKTRLNNKSSENYLGADIIPDNQRIIALRAQLKNANDDYIDNGFQSKDKKRADSIQLILNSQLIKSTDTYVNDPLIAKQSLVNQRLDLEVALDKAQGSIATIDNELATLNAKFTTMVPFDASVQNLERDADVATKDYLDILNRYNQSNLDKNIGLRLSLEQEGVPTGPEPSKKVIFMALSLIASLAICFASLFLIFALDHSINDLKTLKLVTRNPVIGKMNYIKPNDRNIDDIWKSANVYKDYLLYKNLLRSVRFEINKVLAPNDFKILGITSLHPEDNKIFSAISLAYAFARLGKQILVIGDDEMAGEIKKLNIPVDQSFKTLFKTGSIHKNAHITFLNNELDGLSLLENKDKSSITNIFSGLKSEFDLIIIYLDGLNTVTDIKEWILFTDKYLATFMAGNSISDKDKESIQSLKDDDKFIGWVMNGVKQK